MLVLGSSHITVQIYVFLGLQFKISYLKVIKFMSLNLEIKTYLKHFHEGSEPRLHLVNALPNFIKGNCCRWYFKLASYFFS